MIEWVLQNILTSYEVPFICSNEGTNKAMYIDKSGSSSWIRRTPLCIKLFLINFSTEFEFLCGNMHGFTFVSAKKSGLSLNSRRALYSAFIVTWFFFRGKTPF